MEKPKIYLHGSYIGTTGYNNHTRDFTRELAKQLSVKVRNFTVGKSWKGYNLEPHNDEPYLNDTDKSILYKQILQNDDNKFENYIIYPDKKKEFEPDINLVLSETNHHIFYDNYVGPKIAYNVWESTLQPHGFFRRLLEYDEIWVPSQWQKECTIAQGADPDRVKVVPEGVDVETFYPEDVTKLSDYEDNRFKFILFGRWDYRKSTKEIIQTFLSTFNCNEPVDLIVSIDNPWGKELDGFESTEERLESYGLTDPRIKIVHFPSREDYIKYLKTGHVFVSCARSEGWNLPLIEAMACGTPSIYSECSAQMEFANGKGIPVKITGELPADSNNYARYKMSDLPGNYYEPDFYDLSVKMRDAYENYESHKQKALLDSEIIRKDFSWENIGEIGVQALLDFYKKVNSENYVKPSLENEIVVSFIDGPRVEVFGSNKQFYDVEFFDGDDLVHKSVIENNMWTSCNKKYFVNWTIKVNGEVIHQFNPQNKKVLISLESSSIGDTIAWTPYAVEFAKKHNCKVVVSTFFNSWFEGNPNYKDIEFVPPGSSVDCYALYRIGWFRSDNGFWERFEMYPNRVNSIPLQQTATDILGLDYHELNLGTNISIGERPLDNKYVVFGPNATAGCKEWSYENWVLLSKMIKELGYRVVTLTKNPYHIEGVLNVWGESFEVVATYLHHADAFVGLGSGLSWLNWSLNKHTYMINGFSEEGHEFSTNITKIYNKNTCIFCWNDEVFSFDSGDWDWCPVYKGTKKQHICQKSITPLQVFNSLKI